MALAGRRVGDAEAEAAVGEAEDLVGRRRVAIAARIGDDDDLELEPFRRMDRQQPDRVGSLLLGHGVALGRADRLLLLDEADEALDVGAAQLLVRPREPRQLAEVRVAPAAVPLREHGEVIVVVGDDPLAETLQREPWRRLREPVVALSEGAQEPRVVGIEIRRQRPLEACEDRPARVAPDQQQRVVGDADERRRQHADERLVVVAVLEQAEVGEQVDDLLLAEVAASGGAVGGEARAAQLLLVPLGVGTRGEEEDDLTGRRDARVDELLDPPGDVRRLGPPPVHAGSRVCGLVGHEQLDRCPEHRVGELAGRRQRLELLPELGAEEVVDHGEHLGPRAVVARQRQQRLRPRPPLAEDLHVRVAEAVDRLELVPDEEPLGVGPGQQIDELALEPVRVLELVDHDRAEAQPLALAQRLVVAEQVAGVELEILEVERRLAVLRRCVLGREAVQQLLQQLAVLQRQLVERRLLDRLPRLLVARRPFAARPQPGEVEQALGQRRRLREHGRLGCRIAGGVGRVRIVGKRARRPLRARRAGPAGRPARRARGRARGPRSAASRTPSSASAAGRLRRRSPAASGGRARRRRRTRSAPPRRPHRGSRGPGCRRGRGSAGRGRPRTDATSAGAGRSRGSSRSRRRRASAPGRGGRARAGGRGYGP